MYELSSALYSCFMDHLLVINRLTLFIFVLLSPRAGIKHGLTCREEMTDLCSCNVV